MLLPSFTRPFLHQHHHHFLVSLLNQCKSMAQLKQIHAQLTTHGVSNDNFLISKLLLFSAVSDSGDIGYSLQVFDSLPFPNTFIYNTLIRGFSRSKNPNPSFALYNQMLRSEVPSDHLTYPFLAKSCARLALLRLGLSVHCHVAKNGHELDRFVQSSLIHMYASCGDVGLARRVFDGISGPNLASWNALVDGYAKCGNLVAARDLFDRMPERDVVSWSAMIDGYVKGGEYREALAMSEMMGGVDLGPRANEVTMVSVLCACAHLGALDKGRRIHQYLKENGFRMSLALSTSLIDMYAKCGAIHEALGVFHAVPVEKTDVLIWNAVIGGLAMHGMGKESVEMFRRMRNVGVIPDEITYLGLLSACVHGGLVDEAWNFFRSLEAQGMTPHVEHYACLVDVLGRAGRIEEAYNLVDSMPVQPSASVIGALVSSCHAHGWVHLGEVLGKRLVELEPHHDGRYIGLSNIYAVARRWDDAKTMREAMEKRGVKKVPGCSEIDVDGIICRFIAHDKAHPQSTEIYSMLILITLQMKMEDDSIIQEASAI
ncbi:pentatricopeptide repeat-containing protein At5g08305 [Typha angustifolia]|uniref:pentatricopeptide repeat-containing protein At5g08305 n=1 Tax=Typha angustifolia TaxID=59011 RepID=UPI003C2B5914